MHITLEEAKSYLRIDTNDEDALITKLISSAEKQVQDVTRLSDEDYATDSDVIRIAVLFTVAYLFEHREEADHKALNLTLRSLLFGQRQEEF
jgi:uncharacterized phage protein (predicted DNA packaging)